jgi:amidase
MPITPPTAGDLASIAQHYGLHLAPEDLESFRVLAARLLASYDQVERLYEASRPEPPQRPYQWPAEDGNDLGAWYVTTEITTRRDGPLAGRRVAVKDNIAVAGIPMMNGSRAIEGFVPRRDATVVTRLLDAGATIAGKAVCEDLCLSGGSHTSRTGPVRNPWDRSRTAGGSSSGSAALVAAGPTSRSAVTRAARSVSPARSAAPSGTSQPTAWSPIRGRSRSRTPSTTWARSPRTSGTPR